MRNVINTTGSYIVKLLKSVYPESSHQKGNIFSNFFNVLSIWDDRYSLNFLWKLFPDVCRTNPYALCLKLIQCCITIIAQWNWKKKFWMPINISKKY